MNSILRFTPILQIVLAVSLWLFVSPQTAPLDLIIGMGTGLVAWSLSGDRPGLNPRLLTRCSLFILILGGSLSTISILPERRFIILCYVPFFTFLSGIFCKKSKFELAHLILLIGLSAAPLTELHLERDPWSLLAGFFLGLELICVSGCRFFSCQLRAIAVFSIYLLIVMIGVSVSVYPYATARHLGILLLDLYLFMAICTVSTDEENRKMLVQFLLALVGSYVLFTFVSAGIRIFHMGWQEGLRFRIFVFERHPNYAIFPILLTIPLWLPYIFDKHPLATRIIAGSGFLGSLFYILVYSYSREGWIVLMVYAILIAMLYKKSIPWRVISGGIGAVLLSAITVCVLFKGIYYRFITIFDLEGSQRYQAWRIFWNLITDRPFFGYGLGTNRYIYPQALSHVNPIDVPTRQFLFEAHNAYIDILVGTGIIGACMFILFLIAVTFFRSRPANLEMKSWIAVSAAVWIDLFFNYRLHTQDTGPFLMILLAMITSAHALDPSREKSSVKVRDVSQNVSAHWRLVLTTVICIFALLPWLGNFYVKKAQTLLKTTDWETVRSTFQIAAAIEPLRAHPHYYLALCAKQMNKPDDVVREFQKAVQLNPNDAFYRYHLGSQYSEMRELPKALKQLEIAKLLEPSDEKGIYRFDVGILNLLLGNERTARRDLWTALLLNPELAKEPFWNSHRGLYQELIRDTMNFIGLVILPTDFSQPYLHLLMPFIQILEQSGFQDPIDHMLMMAAYQHSSDPDVIVNAAWYFIQNGNMESAENVLMIGLGHTPHIADYHNLLGHIYLQRNDLKLAQAALERGRALWTHISVDNLFGYVLLADVYTRLNQIPKAQSLERKINYLKNGVFQIQCQDLTRHRGTNRYELSFFRFVNP